MLLLDDSKRCIKMYHVYNIITRLCITPFARSILYHFLISKSHRHRFPFVPVTHDWLPGLGSANSAPPIPGYSFAD